MSSGLPASPSHTATGKIGMEILSSLVKQIRQDATSLDVIKIVKVRGAFMSRYFSIT